MRFAARYTVLAAAAAATVVAGGCQSNNTAPTVTATTLPAPESLLYQLDPSGTPAKPAGILLRWKDVVNASVYRVYSRADSISLFVARALTTSNTFHDNGAPDFQYYVTAVDANGGESTPSNAITVDERLVLQAPASLTSISLDSAIDLDWADNAFLTAPTRFALYRVYSASFSGVCGTDWALEGTTVAHEFLVGQLANGVTRCYATSAISHEGYESLWSPIDQDTPRPDGRNVLVWAAGVNPGQSGFRFWNDLNGNGYPDPGELGLVQANTTAGIDFRVDVNPSDSSLWFVPVFPGDSLQQFGTTSIADLTSIDVAPTTGYKRDSLQAKIGFGYVFSRMQGTLIYYAGLRVTATSHQYVIFDWSVQTAPGNPQLVAGWGPALSGSSVSGSR